MATLLALSGAGCTTTSPSPGTTPAATAATSGGGQAPTAALTQPMPATSSPPLVTASAPAAAPPKAPAPSWTRGYAWLEGSAIKSAGSLEARFPADPGFTRVRVEDGSFPAFLRALPLAEPGTAVVSFRGATILAPDDPRLAAVVAIDVGDKDLQQCADSVIRMHAEWRRAVGRGDVSYKSLSGFPMPYERYRRGERFVLAGKDLAWTGGGRPDDSRATFRGYLDNVFMWANTVGLARDAAKVPRADVRAGDFFVLGGAPGHAVMILDVAVAADGKKRALIGQGYMPAQSFHVIRAADGSPWFSLDGDEVKTPFWAPFPWESLRRLD